MLRPKHGILAADLDLDPLAIGQPTSHHLQIAVGQTLNELTLSSVKFQPDQDLSVIMELPIRLKTTSLSLPVRLQPQSYGRFKILCILEFQCQEFGSFNMAVHIRYQVSDKYLQQFNGGDVAKESTSHQRSGRFGGLKKQQ